MFSGVFDPYSTFLGPPVFKPFEVKECAVSLNEMAEKIISKIIEPDFEKNEIKEEYEYEVKVYPDPTTLDKYSCFIKEAILLIPYNEYCMFRVADPIVLRLRAQKSGKLLFDCKDSIAKCVFKHLHIEHHKEGYSTWKIVFSKIEVDARCYFGSQACSVVIDMDSKTCKWEGEEGFCKAYFCEICTQRSGCSKHGIDQEICWCYKRNKEIQKLKF